MRVPRFAALVTIAVLVAASALVSFAESYRGLFLWASRHGLSGGWGYIWPLQVDVFIAVGEVALFVALVDRWAPRQRAGAWAVTLAGLVVSVAGNVGHAPAHDLATRVTYAVPPLAAAAALAVGLGVLKRGRDGAATGARRTVPATMPTCRHVVGDPAGAIAVAVEHARECLDQKVTIRGLSRQTGIDHRKLSTLAKNVPAGIPSGRPPVPAGAPNVPAGAPYGSGSTETSPRAVAPAGTFLNGDGTHA